MSGSWIKLASLSQEKSRSGSAFFKGFMGLVEIIVWQDPAKGDWALYIIPKVPKFAKGQSSKPAPGISAPKASMPHGPSAIDDDEEPLF